METKTETTQHDLLITEERLLKVSTSVIYGCAVAIVAAVIWLTTMQIAQGQTRKDFDDHVKSGTEYRALNNSRWLRVNNALIRMQTERGIKIPKAELMDPLSD